MPCAASTLLQPGAQVPMVAALARYPANYDEVLDEVHVRLAGNGHATKLDLDALIAWKHVRNAPWMQQLNCIPNNQVITVTGSAFAQPTDALRVAELKTLPGFGAGGAFTSALFAAWDSAVYGTYDKFVVGARPQVVNPACVCTWAWDLPTYFDHLRRLATELTAAAGTLWTARNVDMAMYEL